MNPKQEQRLMATIAEERQRLGAEGFFIHAPGLGEDAVVDGVRIYGSPAFGARIYGQPEGACAVVPDRYWEDFFEAFRPSLVDELEREIQSFLQAT